MIKMQHSATSSNYGVQERNQREEAATNGVLIKKEFLRNFVKFTRKHLCRSLFFNKLTAYMLAILLKKRIRHRRFLMNFAKFLITTFLQNTSGRLLLEGS